MSDVATARRARAKRQVEAPTIAERNAAAEHEGAKLGAKLQGRLRAYDVVTTAAALKAEGLALSQAASAEVAEAAAELQGAEDAARNADSTHLLGGRRTGRNVGRWVGRDEAYMTGRDVASVAKVAALTAARQIRAAGCPKLENDELADLELDLMAVALERGNRLGHNRDGCPRWDTCDPERLSEAAAIGRAYIAAPHGERMDALSAEARKVAHDYRGAWRAFLTGHARTFARRRVAEYRLQRRVEDAARDRAGENIAAKVADAEAIADGITARLSLSDVESRAVVAALDGLTHRERAAAEGITVEAAKQRAKYARKVIRGRFPSSLQVRMEVAAAERAAEDAMAREVRANPEWRAEARADHHARICADLMSDDPVPPAERIARPRAARGLLAVFPRRIVLAYPMTRGQAAARRYNLHGPIRGAAKVAA